MDGHKLIFKGYVSSGRESHVFRAKAPDGLFGVHADLVAEALDQGEKIHYLIYAPIRKAGAMPFGVRTEPASHGVAVTEKRFLVSVNPHVEHIKPTLHSIPFNAVAFVELGNAMLLGWLVIHYVDNFNLSSLSLAYTARGFHHFAAAVREYRRLSSGQMINCSDSRGSVSSTKAHRELLSQAGLLQSLMTRDERLQRVFRSVEKWRNTIKPPVRTCLSTEGIFILTSGGMIHIIDQAPIRPNMHSFGMNAYCFPLDALKTIEVINTGNDRRLPNTLHLQMMRRSVAYHHDVPFALEQNDAIEHLKTYLNQAD